MTLAANTGPGPGRVVSVVRVAAPAARDGRGVHAPLAGGARNRLGWGAAWYLSTRLGAQGLDALLGWAT
ncbi:hypothetical protein, partial [Streptomyces sp. NPDC055134]